MKLVRKILLPVVPIYYLVTSLRNRLYDSGVKSSSEYDFPLICVGNLSVGGTGKTPMIEYLIRLLAPQYRLATLSRGYKRKTKGFGIANEHADARTLGDEPYQMYKKFKDIIVSVDADRRNGIDKLRALNVSPDVILLDDAYQHRRVKAGLNILLTSFDDLYCDDILLPTGNLREPKSGAIRADIIVVTKCPSQLSEQIKNDIIKRLKIAELQHVFFSEIAYSSTIKNENNDKALDDLKSTRFTLVTGIANPKPLVSYLKGKGLDFEHLNFNDHHEFSKSEIENIKSKLIVLTTEKDFVRIESQFKNDDNLYYLPIEAKISDSEKFDVLVNDFCDSFK